jgi:regulatory protein
MTEDQPTITRLTPIRRDPSRLTVRAGGRAVATLGREQIEAMGLTVGMAWTEALAARVASAAEHDKARRYAARALGRRALSRGELIDRMRRRGHDESTATGVADELEANGWLDDRAYGRMVIDSERSRKPAGAALLRHKLAHKRVPRRLAEQLIDQAEQNYDAVAEARSLAERRLATASLQRCDRVAKRRRLWGLLARRGFCPQVIREALDPVLGEGNDDPQS